MKTVEKEVIKCLTENVKSAPMISKEIKYSITYLYIILRNMKSKGLLKIYGKSARRNYWYLSKKGKKLLKKIS